MNSNNRTLPFLFAFIILFALFYGLGLLTSNLDWTWSRILICLVTVSGVTITWRLIKKEPLAQSFRNVGFGVPNWRVTGIALGVSVVMMAFFPLYSNLANVQLPLQNNWTWILIGIITGVGIAEETLFRGYVFNFLREKRTFWQAATLSMILFGAMHLLLLLWLPLPIAIAAIILAIIAAYPTAFLFETGNRTIWPSAILHTTALATNLFEFPAEITVLISLMWIGIVVIGLFLVFVAGKLILKVVNQSPTAPVKPQIVKRKSWLFVWLKRIALWLVIGIIALAAIGAIWQAIGTQMDKRAYPPPGQMIDVGGYQMHLYCTGANVDGSPTVILEQGLGGISSAWALVQPEVAKVTRVCSYDRAGMGWSDSSPEPRDAQHIAQELHTLLQSAGVPGPYVLVGWSFGGLYVRAYAGQYGDEVSGMVLIDSSHPDQWTSTSEGQAQFESNAKIYSVAPALVRLGVMRVMGLLQPASGLPMPYSEALKASFAATKDWDAQSGEFLASLATATQVRESGSLDKTPLFVLTATQHGTPPKQEQLWQGWQIDLTSLSTNSVRQIVEGADHVSFWCDPETAKVSIAAILQVVEAARTGAALK